MTRSKYPRSVAKYIRRQKALIRRTTQQKEEQEKLIRELLNRVSGSEK
jgi:hypothetical protein